MIDPLQTAMAEARVEMLSRLEQFALQPGSVLDLGGAVSEADPSVLPQRFPRARVIISSSAVDRGDADRSTAIGASDTAAASLAARLQQWWQRVVHRGRQHLGKGATTARVERILAAPTALPLADGSVDLVLGQWLMPGAETLDAVLVEIRRCLSPGGLFLWTSAGPLNGESPMAGALDMHDLGSALARAGFLEPVLDVDRYVAARCEVIHAAAFAGAPGRAVAGEVVIPLQSLRRGGEPR
ncbi:MAG: methyltransferase domain-containing protein [Sinobacteraceae bacterium]|nr:methyltransferase domain-containing protein [Nevskiaceae bacterium]